MQAIERQTMYGQQEGYYHNFFFLYTTKYVVKKKLTSETGKRIMNWSLTND